MRKNVLKTTFILGLVLSLTSFKADQDDTSTGRKFFGTQIITGACQSIGNSGHGIQAVTETFYIFGIAISSSTTFQNCDSSQP